MDGLGGSIVNVVLPVIAADFGTDTGTIAWVVITYLLMMAGFLLVFGKFADRGHIRKVFIGGFIIFTAGSAVFLRTLAGSWVHGCFRESALQ